MGSIIDRRRSANGKVRRYVVYMELDGRQKWWPTPHGTTRAQARAYLATAESNVASGRVGITPKPKPEEVRARRTTLGEMVDLFCSKYTNPKLKDLERYRAEAKGSLGMHVKKHRIAALPAVEVTTQLLRDWRDELLAEPEGAEDARGPAPETVKRVLALLSRLYNWAADKGLVDCRNPVSKVEKPVNHQADDFDFLSQEEVANLLSWAAQRRPDEYPLYATAAYTGMRFGELAGLRWTDVDFEMSRIHVRRSYRTLPKSGKQRTIPMSPHLAPVLRAWKERCPATDENLVFPAPLSAERGKLTREQVVALRTRALGGETCAQLARAFGVSWNAVKKIVSGQSWDGNAERPNRGMRSKDGDSGFDSALQAAGSHRVRFHDLRHTFASHFVMAGGSIVALKELLGHHDIKVTQKYAHLAPHHLAAEAARVNFQPATKEPGKIVSLAEHGT